MCREVEEFQDLRLENSRQKSELQIAYVVYLLH